MVSQALEKMAKKLPDCPGVYFFLRGKTILYIGKATSLRSRVKSYFAPDLAGRRGPVVAQMTERADKIKFIKTDSVLEALILEANLIKKHQPSANTQEKDDKSFNYVGITSEDFPRVLIIRGREISSSLTTNHYPLTTIFGPFPNAGQLKEALKIIRKIFPFLSEKDGDRKHQSFYRAINLAPDVASAEAKKTYQKTIRNIVLLFQGKKKSVIKNLEKEMKSCAAAREFERAGEIKRQIFALQHIHDVSLLRNNDADRRGTNADLRRIRIEAYDISHLGGTNVVGAMAVVADGEPDSSQYRKFKIRSAKSGDDLACLAEILTRRFGHPEWPAPDMIAVDGGENHRKIGEQIAKSAGKNIPVVAVVKDEKHKPKDILGNPELAKKYRREILLANSEAHRFSLHFQKSKRWKTEFDR